VFAVAVRLLIADFRYLADIVVLVDADFVAPVDRSRVGVDVNDHTCLEV